MSGLIGRSLALRRLLQEAEVVAQTDATVLIHGETGTGKELVATAIHRRSGRPGGFVKVNCAAVPASLFESELMGHEKGAFTGAFARRIGRFEAAEHGTIFLDEIGEMPLETQPKLLRLLQEREFERLGSNQTIRANARLVAATNRDLGAMVANRTFREDLFYRLSVFPIEVPPLRQRREDIPELAGHFATVFADRAGRCIEPISDKLMARLCGYDWPGNIRELMNVIERAVILATDGVLQVGALSGLPTPQVEQEGPHAETAPKSMAPRPPDQNLDRLDDVERRHILTVLESTNWVIGGLYGAAARLGLKRPTLIYRMKKLGIDRSLRACSAESSRVGLSGCPRGGVLNGALQRSYTDPFDRTSPPIPIGPHTDKAGPMTSAPRR
ncbi:MAG: sigma 54-interacting transcriptional regulator [Polyangiaceae bacterium]